MNFADPAFDLALATNLQLSLCGRFDRRPVPML
jgi:hypothetical protein